MLKLIKDRFYDFKKSEYLEEFFKSASFTLYILTLHLHLPDTHFFRVVEKYDEVTYENTIKLIIRCKILYEAREILVNIIKMIHEREYSAALVQTQIAAIDSLELMDDVASIKLRSSLKELLAQSAYIEQSIQQFRAVRPFDRVFLYKGGDYLHTIKQYHGMLNRVLEVHDMDIYNL